MSKKSKNNRQSRKTEFSNAEINESILSPRHDTFCREYIIDLNGTQAAMRAGYSQSGAAVEASRLLLNPNICLRIRQLLDERNLRTQISADAVLVELYRLAKSDVRKIFDSKGALLPIDSLDDNIAPCISSIEIDEIWEGFGPEKQIIGQTKKIKFWDKTRALELLGKHLALFIEKTESKNENTNTIKIDRQDENL